MARTLARTVLLGASAAFLVASFAQGPLATLLGVLAAGAFPAALFLLAERRQPPVWILLLGLSLTFGLAVAVFWKQSPDLAGLPQATWLTWLLAGVVPFILIVYGLVVRHEDSR